MWPTSSAPHGEVLNSSGNRLITGEWFCGRYGKLKLLEGRLNVQGLSGLCNEFKVGLGSILRPCHMNEEK